MRPFLYRSSWPWQFRSIDRAVATANKSIVNTHKARKTPGMLRKKTSKEFL
jgi:hypothetical protein